MRTAGWLVGVALFAAVGTWLAGWPAVAVVGGVAGVAAPRRRHPVLLGGAGAALGWGALLLVDSWAEGFPLLTTLIAELLGRPWPVLVGVTLALAALLGAAGALVGLACRRPLSGYGS